LMGAVAAMPPLADAYQARRLAEHPCQAAIVYLQDQAVWPNRMIVSDQIAVWQTFAPWLQDDYAIRIIDGYDPTDRPWDTVVAERLATYVQDQEFWWLTYGAQPSHAAQYFAQPEVRIIEEMQLGTCQLARVQHPVAPPLGRFDVAGGPILLRSFAVEQVHVGEVLASALPIALPIVLYWESESPVGESYTVFTHLVDADGQLVVQQDNLPVAGLAPTDTWQPGVLIRDPYRLTLPANTGPGDYRLLVGLYTATGRRTVTWADGSTADHLSIPIRLTAYD